MRTLRKDRGFAVITVLILALGIAANTAVFSVVNTVLLRPLPFPGAHQLTWLTSGRQSIAAGRDPGGLSGVTYTVDAYEEFQRHNHSFQQLASYNPFLGNSEYTLTGRGEAQPIAAVMVSANFFPTLGVEPILGRQFSPEECQKGGRPAALLSYAFWQRQFAGNPAIVGQGITLSKQPVTVVGILPATFDFGAVFAPGTKFDLYVPAVMDDIRNWGNTLALVGRLKPGVSVAQAQAEADVLLPQLKAAHKEWWGDYTSTITGLKEFVSGKLRSSLIVLWSAVGLILLIVCVNLSNLMLARAAARSKEFAVRSALGAGQGRLLRQLLMESVVLSCAGALIGLGLAFAITTWLARQGSIALPLLATSNSMEPLAVDPAPHRDRGRTLRHRPRAQHLRRQSTERPQGQRRRHDLRPKARAPARRPGDFRSGPRLRPVGRCGPAAAQLPARPRRRSRISARPRRRHQGGLRRRRQSRAARCRPAGNAAQRPVDPRSRCRGYCRHAPLGRNRSWGLSAKGKIYPKGQNLSALVRIVTPGYLKAMGMHLKDGRDFTWQDTPKSERVMILNQAAARQRSGKAKIHWDASRARTATSG